MCSPGMGMLPVSLGLLMMIAIVTTYILAVLRGDVEAVFPYISDTGVDIPESCIFAQFFNMAAFLALCTTYLRQKMVREITNDSDPRVNRLSNVCLILATLSALGITLVANFQETKIEPVHLTGAFMVFGFGVLYSLLDTSISYLMTPEYNGIYICRVRLAISLCGVVSLFVALIAGAISREQWAAGGIVDHDRQHWKPDDPGYSAHLVSTFGEWAMALAFLVYFFTYIRDFQKFHVEVKTVLSVSHLDELPYSYGPDPDESTRLLA